jgi:hypothetical protein
MASTFFGIGFIPDLLIHYPRHSILSAQKVDFSAFTRKPLSDIFLEQIPIFLNDPQMCYTRLIIDHQGMFLQN